MPEVKSKAANLVLAAVLASASPTEAVSAPTHQWKPVPGHKNISVDLASVSPMWTSYLGPRDYGVSPPRDLFHVPTETTDVTIRLNGHIFRGYMITCSGFGAPTPDELPATVYFPQRINEPPTRVMGYVPAGAVEKLVCPRARLVARVHLPPEVTSFVGRSLTCLSWESGPRNNSAAERARVEGELVAFGCDQVDRQEKILRDQYARNPDIIAALNWSDSQRKAVTKP
jgi:hypothetical protein